MTITGNFIGGKTVTSSSRETMPVYDPATGDVVREVTLSTAQEVSDAIQVARDAFDSWSRTTPLRRARVLFNFKMLLNSTSMNWRELSLASTAKCGPMRWAS